MNIHARTYLIERFPDTLVKLDGKPIGFFSERTDTLSNGTPVRVYVTRLGEPGNAGPAVELHTRNAAIAWIVREATEEHRI